MNKSKIQVIVTVCLMMLVVSSASAGDWIAFDHDGLGSGSWLCYAGRDGVGVARGTSNSLLFFNARTGQWIEHELDTPMSVVSTLADGFLVLVVGYDRAVVFNTMTSSVSELAYAGSLMSTSGDTRSFDCGPELALVVTDQEFCVFDAEIDSWGRHAYTLSATSGFTARHQCHDTYAASFLPLTNSQVVNLVYSLDQHEFNEESAGLHAPTLPMAHGYAGFRSQYLVGAYFLGYSAVTNTFDRVDLSYGLPMSVAALNASESIGSRTTFVGHYFEDYPDDIRHYHVYGYDTRHGDWQHQLIIVDSTEFSLSDWTAGGTYCATRYWNHEAGVDDLLVFNGAANSFSTLSLGLEHTVGIIAGGDVVAGTGDTDVAGIDLDGVRHAYSGSPYDSRSFVGLDYLDYLSDGPGEDLMTVHCYNGEHNTWLHHTTGAHSSSGNGTGHVHLRQTDDPQREAVFYSAYRHEMYAMSLEGWPMVSPSPTEHYAVIRNDGEGVGALYDAHRGSVYSWSGIQYTGVAERIFTLVDNTAAEARAYSLTTGTWSSQALDAECVVVGGRDLVSLVKHAAMDVYYACDASDGEWATLNPAGAYAARMVGDHTALYLTSTHAYALGVSTITAIQMDDFTLQAGPGTVDASWAGTLGLEAGDLCLTGRGPAPSACSWTIPVARDETGRFRAQDDAPALALGGLFTYTLDVTTDGDMWTTAASAEINLQAIAAIALDRIYPNPFNPQTSIDFVLAEPQNVTLRIYDLAGRCIRTLEDGALPAGRHTAIWDGRNDGGRSLASGSYMVRLSTETGADELRVLLVR